MFFGPFRGQIFKFENETLSIGIDGFYFEYRNTLKKVNDFINSLLDRGARPRDIRISLEQVIFYEGDRQRSEIFVVVRFHGVFGVSDKKYKMHMNCFVADNINGYTKAREFAQEYKNILPALFGDRIDLRSMQVIDGTYLYYDIYGKQNVKAMFAVIYYVF
ncbi:MAG: hypothetical protein A2725_03465 [Candidatus Magasanikbacteria bacterium RIFCSPHIGHO2_01_FULL_33_34]|uniref:Uncharacterized protein n=1 Tax=Candidatus Magasanikbacteria bacterium RIFCSPHIGHO2_01_FULL_33_34 TaxID=1798671 RepID=A0A1F6LHE5_9BACT|nr:MAG: hypothetical protein A2725_03465 [Candidatus Magasanikbacteria bacterium RIFCSPHIGHO2_01_FULL_33_34]OGH66188.1 MAG: hypothetical protein A3B83_00955 [Candidatus Magasanikbacteria bacterium RIFCSPHIGHO2_02_FULL_33_17]OGH76034.1 MAG: hypothetical protein A3A89_00865 [Candidatus Magasanikbacteria bacterium RIFCSPLOWO2_01_FULL_33_34]OGH82639.1 MAG: hypothetical protein A3F93_02335 [Candidatus Magasanikbacteria bacterium RIFCSPLOWO2_12_FULL_34_7]